MRQCSSFTSFLQKITGLAPYLQTDDQARLEMSIAVHDVFNCDAMLLSQFDPLQRHYSPLIQFGYQDKLLTHLNGWFMEHDPAMEHQRKHSLEPARWRDYPFHYATSYSAEEFFKPAGFLDGVTLVLTNHWESVTGVMHINVMKDNLLSRNHLNLMNSVRAILGGNVDLKRTLCNPSDYQQWNCFFLRYDDDSVIAMNRQNCMDLEGISILLQEKIKQLNRWPRSGHVRLGDHWYQIQTTQRQNGMIVYWRKISKPKLTERELDVATGLTKGMSNKEIARDLNISESTVSNYIENIMQKTQGSTRTSAAIACDRASLVAAFR